MTVTQTTNQQTYDGDGLATARTWSQKLFATEDLTIVQITDGTLAETAMSLNEDYSLLIAADYNSATITPLNSDGIPTGTTWVATRNQPLLQGLNQQATQVLNAEGLERTLDKIVLGMQDLRRDVDRALKAPSQDTGLELAIDMEIANRDDRKDKLLSFNATTGDPELTEITDISANAVTMTDIGKTIVTDTNAAAVRASLVAEQNVMTTRGDIMVESAVPAASRLPVGTLEQVLAVTEPLGTDTAPRWSSVPLPTAAIFGLSHTNATADVVIQPGSARDRTDAFTLRLSSEKTRDPLKAYGTDDGGMSSSLNGAGHPTSSTWYHIFLAHDASLDLTDVLFDTNINATTVIADHDFNYVRRIGSFYKDADGELSTYYHSNGYHYWAGGPIEAYTNAGIVEVAGGTVINPSSSPTFTYTPPVRVIADLVVESEFSDEAMIRLTGLGAATAFPHISDTPMPQLFLDDVHDGKLSANFPLLIGADQTVRVIMDLTGTGASTDTFRIGVLGYQDQHVLDPSLTT